MKRKSLRQTYILIVQGDEGNGNILFRKLKKLGYKVKLFSNGKLALEYRN